MEKEKNIFARKNEELLKASNEFLNKNEVELLKKDKNSKETEKKLQADCFQWFHNTFPALRGLLWHVPNGEKRDPITANLLKAVGVVAGAPDLNFFYSGRVYFFEAKRPDGKGSLSKDQIKVHRQLEIQGFIVWTFDNLDAFQCLIYQVLGYVSQDLTIGLKKDDYYYKHKVFDYIYSLGDCQLVKIGEVCEEHNEPKFVRFIKDFIIEGFAELEGFEVLFTPDYKAFYKKIKGTNEKVTYNGKTYEYAI
jgi:hypothetical protein